LPSTGCGKALPHEGLRWLGSDEPPLEFRGADDFSEADSR
jgi:hypothetical protein